MSTKIITISREFGSGGRYIGTKLADKLGVKFYDKDIIAKVAQETGFADKFIEEQGEYAVSKNIFSYGFMGRTADGMSTSDHIYIAQRRIINSIADEGPCVIVGRCADYILKDRENVLNVFIFGREPEKLARITKMYGKTEKEALAMCKDMNKKRAINYQYYTDQKWGETKNYDLCLNSSALGYEKCVDILADLA